MKHGHILGIELTDKICQVSFYDEIEQEPHTVEMGTDQYQIPLTIAFDGVDWVCGEKAEQYDTCVSELYSYARKHELVQVGEQSYESIWLLSVYMQLVLKQYEDIESIAFTIPVMDIDIAQIFRSLGQKLGVSREHIYVMDYRESFCNYMFYQPRELWQYAAALFYCDGKQIRAYLMRKLNTGFGAGHSTFVVVDQFISEEMEELKKIYPIVQADGMREADARFSAFVKAVFQRKLISSVFLTGPGFEGAWYPDTLRILCNGRRVFQGNNLYSKGACYGAYAKEVLHADDLIYLDETKMSEQILMRLRIRGKEIWYPIVAFGTRWYEADRQFDVLLEDTQDIEIRMESLLRKDAKVIKIPLDGLPQREKYSLRLQMNFLFTNEKTCKIVLKDVGFGTFFAPSEFHKEVEIQLGGNDGQFNSMS